MSEKITGLPIIGDVDLCVLGGKLYTVYRALSLAKQGKKVLLAVKESCLGEDICQTFRYRLSEEECSFFPEETRTKKLGLLRPDEGKRFLEDCCLEAGIMLLYGIWPVDCPEEGRDGRRDSSREEAGSRKRLVRVAAKGGLFGILCDEAWQEEEVAAAQKGYEYTVLAGGFPGMDAFEKKGSVRCGEKEVFFCLEGEEGKGLLTISLPDGGLRKRWAGQTDGSAGLLTEAQETAAEVFGRLKRELPWLQLGRFAPRAAVTVDAAEGKGGEHKAGMAKGQENRLYGPDWKRFSANKAEGCRTCAISSGDPSLRSEEAGIYRKLPVVDSAALREEHYDLVVAGGGTAGAMAALYAARGGLRTVLLEPMYTLGGTATAGGVSTYWFGNRFRDVREIDAETEKMAAPLGLPRREGIWDRADDFHPGIRGTVLARLCLEAGVELRFGSMVFGTLCERTAEGRRCCGAAAAGPDGLYGYYGRAVIDATGDGDLAVSAGADAVYGSERDCITYWASLAQYTDVNRYRNNFSSMVVSADPADMTRFILLGRRRGEQTCDHGGYVSMRESRHVKGVYTVNLKDLMDFRIYPDALYTCYSNYDPKGKLDADVIYCGVLPPQVKIQIPLSALLPCEEGGGRIEGLYVAGKAVSATHNVFPSIRMQPDLMHQGAMLGGLLAESLKQGMLPEQMECAKRREFLLKLTEDPLTLPALEGKNGEAGKQALEKTVYRITAASRTHWVDVPFIYEETEESPVTAAVTAESEEVLPLLLKRLREETSPYDWKNGRGSDGCPQECTGGLRIRLIGLCLWHGWEEEAEEYAAFVEQELSGSGLPERAGSVMCAQLLPDHGVMPETVYHMNLLGRSGKDCILPVFERALMLLAAADRDYEDIHRGIYHYVESFAYAAEHSGRKEFIPMLQKLIRFPEFAECMKEERQVALMTERLQILYLILCRALAGLGEEDGVRGLRTLQSYPAGLAVRLSAGRAEREERKRRNQKIW